MATTVTCDLCPAPALGKVRVTIELEGAVEVGRPTGRVEELDSCANCRSTAAERLFGECLEAVTLGAVVENEARAIKAEINALEEQREELRKKHVAVSEELRPPKSGAAREALDPKAEERAKARLAEIEAEDAELHAQASGLREKRRATLARAK